MNTEQYTKHKKLGKCGVPDEWIRIRIDGLGVKNYSIPIFPMVLEDR